MARHFLLCILITAGHIVKNVWCEEANNDFIPLVFDEENDTQPEITQAPCNLNTCVRFQNSSLEIKTLCSAHQKMLQDALSSNTDLGRIESIINKLAEFKTLVEQKLDTVENTLTDTAMPEAARRLLTLLIPADQEELMSLVDRIKGSGVILNSIKSWVGDRTLTKLKEMVEQFIKSTIPEMHDKIETQIKIMSDKNKNTMNVLNRNIMTWGGHTKNMSNLLTTLNNIQTNEHGKILIEVQHNINNIVNTLKNFGSKSIEAPQFKTDLISALTPIQDNINKVVDIVSKHQNDWQNIKKTIIAPTSGQSLNTRLLIYDKLANTMDAYGTQFTRLANAIGVDDYSGQSQASLYELAQNTNAAQGKIKTDVAEIRKNMPAECDICSVKCPNTHNDDLEVLNTNRCR